MLGDSLVRGAKAGSIAGIVYGLFVYAVASPFLEYVEGVGQRAGAHDHGHAATAGEQAHAAHEHAHAVSELTTAVVSSGGSVLWGLLLGACFGVAYYLFEPAIPGSQSVRPILLAGAGFLTVSVVPWTVLPPAAPGMERSLGIDASLAAYVGLMLVGATLCASSVLLYRRTRRRGRLPAVAISMLPIPLALLGLTVIAPQLVTTGPVPESLATAYRGIAAVGQFLVWLVVAVAFDWLAPRNRSTRATDPIVRGNETR